MKSAPLWKRYLQVTTALLICCAAVTAQDTTLVPAVATAGNDTLKKSGELGLAALQHLREKDVAQALEVLGKAADLKFPAHNRYDDGLSAAAGGLYQSLNALSTDEQYDLLHDWSLPTEDRPHVRILTSLVPEIAPPSDFARALGRRPKKDSFAIATVGNMPGIFCSAWTMVVAADDAGSLRRLITELEGLVRQGTENAQFVLTLAKIQDSRSDEAELRMFLQSRVAGETVVPLPAERFDAVLVAAALRRKDLGPVCEEIAERLNRFDFTSGTSAFVPFLRRLRATAILQNHSPETNPRDLFYTVPHLWVAADDQTAGGRSTGADEAVWLTHEEHVKRLAGPGHDLLLLKYPLTGEFELIGEVAELEHGGGGMTYGGVGFDANSKNFRVQEMQRTASISRTWPFVAPPEHRLFNRINIRSDGKQVTFLSNLHPGWKGSPAAAAGSPWLGLHVFGDGRAIFRNLTLVGEPQIPREVRMAGGQDLRGWTATYGEVVSTFLDPFQPQPESVDLNKETPDWHVSDGVVHGRAEAVGDAVSPSHLAYMRPCLDGETVTYEFLFEEGKTVAHPTLGRLAFLLEPDGVRLHWLTHTAGDWTLLSEDNAIIEPLNRRGPRALPLKAADWNKVTLQLTDGTVSLSLNGEQIYQRPLEDMSGRHFGFYHDRNRSAVQVRNVVLTGDWPDKLEAELLNSLVTLNGPPSAPTGITSR